MKKAKDKKKRVIMSRIGCEESTYNQFKEIVKPLTVSAALGIMITSAVESNKKPFLQVIDDLLEFHFHPRKKGTLLDNIETSRYREETPSSTGDESSQPEGKKKR